MTLAGAEIDTIIATLCGSVPDIEAIWLFGSAGDGTLKTDSDVDLAVLLAPGRRLAAHTARAIDAALGPALGRPIDLIDLRGAPDTLRVMATWQGRLLWARDAQIPALFETEAAERYQTWRLDVAEAEAGLRDRLATPLFAPPQAPRNTG